MSEQLETLRTWINESDNIVFSVEPESLQKVAFRIFGV